MGYLPQDTIEINGIKFNPETLVSLLKSVTNPDPTRWYRYARTDDTITVTVKTELP